jgi:hypothetical protein
MTDTADFFRVRLDEMVDIKHPLVPVSSNHSSRLGSALPSSPSHKAFLFRRKKQTRSTLGSDFIRST